MLEVDHKELFSDADSIVQQLRDQVAELEAENAALRQLQETVRRNSKVFHALLSKSHEGFMLITPQLTFLRVIRSVLGNDTDQLAGRSLLTKMHPEDCGRVTEAFSRLLDSPSESVIVECRVSDARGDWHWMEVEMTDMLDDPDVQAVVWNSREIPGPKRM